MPHLIMPRSLRALSTIALRAFILTLALAGILAASSVAAAEENAYPAASLPPATQPGWDSAPDQLDVSAPPDEAQGGMTEAGTPISKRNEQCFPSEQRDLFSQVDRVSDGTPGGLKPFNYRDADNKVSPEARNAIRGKNTWLLWGEGNEVFWGWVQQHGYGLSDFLILMDSRQRGSRFKDSGLINQPGMKARTDKKVLGLYLDQADGDKIQLQQADNDIDAGKTEPVVRPALPPNHAGRELFTPGEPEKYKQVLAQLADDGLDATIYGYPSGIVGLRLMPNPDFFGNTPAAQDARDYWNKRVEQAVGDAYYTESSINADPKLVRPFRVSMSCGFCHVGPHPLSPPANVEAPEWSDLSSVIGDQYWTPVKTFTNLKKPHSFLYQFLASQQPGTIDTSLVSTDHLNNSNTITAIFDVPARLDRALANPPEEQSASNLMVPHVEDPQPKANPRHTPRVLVDGSDSIGVFGALSRVYVNIGTYSEQWKRLHNTVIGFKPQRPFTVSTLLKNSVYWRTAERYRIPYLAAFFTHKDKNTGGNVASPMYLADTVIGKPMIDAERDLSSQGRAVFVQNCAVCHSSKQPSGFELSFSRDWRQHASAAAGQASLTLPMDFADWTQFTKSAAYGGYVKQFAALAGAANVPDPFIKDNFLSTDIRVPVTLVGTNSARAVATNAMRGQMWDNFSSETYKNLPAVGPVRFFNPYSGKPVDAWGNNDVYYPPAGGPGYYRPASLISLWATAPFLHNNALGEYTHDPSIGGRLRAFEDGIDKILWNSKRIPSANDRPGDLRWDNKDLAGGDQGFIYRTTEATAFDFPANFIRPLAESMLGPFLTNVLTTYLWIGLGLAALALALIGRQRHAGFALALIAVLIAVLLRYSRVDSVYPWLWLVPGAAAVAALLLWLLPQRRWTAPVVFVVLAGLFAFAGMQANAFVNGRLGDLNIGPLPKGTPVNLLMNLNPEAARGDLLEAAFGVTRGILRVRKDQLSDGEALKAFESEAAAPLLRVSKCPDFVLDRGHWFAETLTDEEKKQLKAFLKTL